MRVLLLTSEWPSVEYPTAGVFVLRQVEVLRDLGVEINVLNFRGRGNPLKYLDTFLRMLRLLKREKYDLIHAHFGQAGFISTLQGWVPVVITFHGSDLFGLSVTNLSNRLQNWLLRSVSHFGARNADEVILVSQRLSAEVPRRPYHLIPMGTNLSLFKPIPKEMVRESLGWQASDRIVLFVGNPGNAIKRFDLASRAVAIVSVDMPDIKLRLCYNEPQEFVPKYMNASDVLLVTSLHEAGPLVVREALACNLPVVSVDVGDVRQRIGPISGCVVCDDDRPETIADALKLVLECRRRINGRSTVQELDESLLAQKVVAVYKQTLAHSKTKQL